MSIRQRFARFILVFRRTCRIPIVQLPDVCKSCVNQHYNGLGSRIGLAKESSAKSHRDTYDSQFPRFKHTSHQVRQGLLVQSGAVLNPPICIHTHSLYHGGPQIMDGIDDRIATLFSGLNHWKMWVLLR